MADLILALDQGTTSSRALIVDAARLSDPHQAIVANPSQAILACCGVPFEQHYPAKGWVGHDLNDIWSSTLAAIKGALAQLEAGGSAGPGGKGYSASDIKAIGITNQRETTCAFEPGSGAPLAAGPSGHAIVWQCKRSLAICKGWQEAGLAASIQRRTGLRLDPYFSASKIAWWLEEDSSLGSKIRDGKALVGTVDSYLLHQLTGGESFKTEPSNASRTMLFDLREGDFSPSLMSDLGLPQSLRLPEVVASDSTFGHTKGVPGLADGIPITGILGDQQAALFGQGCHAPGAGKCTYGTGAFLLVNIGELPDELPANLLTTAFYQSRSGERAFALEGAAFIAGAAVDYLKQPLGWVAEPAEASAIMAAHRAAPEVYFVPGFAGLGSPHWQPEAQGAYLGLTRDTTKEQLVAATLEGIAFTVDDMLTEMATIQPLTTLKVDGGLSQSGALMQFQADMAQLPVAVSPNPEATALGAALMAAQGAELMTKDDIRQLQGAQGAQRAPLNPAAATSYHAEAKRGWRAAIHAVKGFAEHRRNS